MDQSDTVVRQGWWTAGRWVSDAATFGIVALGTAAVWGHTIDEIRIGELSALPASTLNLGLLAGWTRLNRGSRGWLSLLFGLWWILTVIPYHVLPLMQGVATWQNFSGLLRVIGGAALIFAGARLLLERRRDEESNT